MQNHFTNLRNGIFDKKTLWPFLFLVSFIIFNILFVTISIIFLRGVFPFFFIPSPAPPRGGVGGDVGWVGGLFVLIRVCPIAVQF